MFEIDDLFEAAVEITASAVEGNHLDITPAGGEAAAGFLSALFDSLYEMYAEDEEDEDEDEDEDEEEEEDEEDEEEECDEGDGDKAKAASGGRFEVYRDAAGEYRFRLKARNGAIIAASEGYKTRRDCLKGIESLRKNSSAAVVELK